MTDTPIEAPTPPLRLSVIDARRQHVCRLCGISHNLPGPGATRSVPFLLAFGDEFAHESCLDRWPPRYWAARTRVERLEARIRAWTYRASTGYLSMSMIASLHTKIARVQRIIERLQRIPQPGCQGHPDYYWRARSRRAETAS